MNEEASNPPPASAAASAPRRRPPFWLMIFVVLFVAVPFLFWRGTWFGRPLTEAETEEYLSDSQRPRRTQHALVQVAERILRGDPTAKRWYPRVEALAAHERAEIRSTVAWVMGQDNQSAEFHAALLKLLSDADPLVRRNAALSLVRFGDPSGRAELRAALLPAVVPAPAVGKLAIRLQVNDSVDLGTLLARIQQGDDKAVEVRSPLPGRVQRWLVDDGQPVSADDAIVLLAPAEEQVWEALRGLYLVGEADDLPAIESFARGSKEMSDRVRQQASLTAEAIHRRTAEKKSDIKRD